MNRAERSAEVLWADDQASRWFGFEKPQVADGTAVLEMTVQPHHCNGHGILHGGVTFAFADSAFAFACNSHNQMTVAQHCAVTFHAPGRLGDVLTATAEEVTLQGRSGLYDVMVHNQDGTLIAEMRGFSRAIKGTLFEE